MRDNNKLPVEWDVATLADVGEIVSGGTPSTTVSEYWNGDINWISPVDLSGYAGKYIAKGKKSITVLGLQKSSAKLMPKGSVLFSSRAPIGYVAIAADELCTNQGFKSIIPGKIIFNEYLYYFLKFAKKQAEDLASGTTFKEISLTNFAKIQIPLPPLVEQHRIVAKIEKLFSNLDKGIERLKAAQQQLKIYRQSVLKWAFEEIINPLEISTEECCSNIVDCLHSTPKFTNNGYYCIDTTCIADSKIILEKMRYVDKDTFIERISRLKPQENDVLFAREGTVGTALLVPKGIEFCLGQRMMMFRLREKILPKYYLFFLQSPNFKNQYKPLIGGTTSPHLNIKDIRKLRIRIASHEVQQSIVSDIERRLSVCDKLEESIMKSLQQAEVLRQSILKKAFEGNLVPQDQDDESVSALLKRTE